MYKTLIFDFDGTLADTIPAIVKELKIEAKERNLKLPEKKIWESQSLYQSIKDTGISSIRSYFMYKKLKENIAPKLEQCKLFPGMSQLIIKLQKQYDVIIVSSNTASTISKILTKNKLDVPIISSHLNKTSVLKKVVKAYPDCIYIGDEVRDIKLAKKLAIHIGSVSWGLNNKESLLKEKPNLLFEKPKDIENAMLKPGKHC